MRTYGKYSPLKAVSRIALQIASAFRFHPPPHLPPCVSIWLLSLLTSSQTVSNQRRPPREKIEPRQVTYASETPRRGTLRISVRRRSCPCRAEPDSRSNSSRRRAETRAVRQSSAATRCRRRQ